MVEDADTTASLQQNGTTCPAFPTALLGRPMAVSLVSNWSWTSLGMRGKIVSK